jgi:uncharacterized protein YprB with RNaseH-like and TPR domain
MPEQAESADPIVIDAQSRLLPGAFSDDGLLIFERDVDLPPGAVALHELPGMQEHAAADWVYIDTETTGLSGGVGNLAFMVGAARIGADARLQLRQWLIPGFAAEATMLRQVTQWVGDGAVLVSYNGKSFDVPVLQARLRLHRIDEALSRAPHLDLVYPVRRAFRHFWPDCRLQTSERRLLDIERIDDLPGAAAPRAWVDWLRLGQAAGVIGVQEHNAQDVISLALLHRYLVSVYRGQGHDGFDRTAVGLAWVRAGDEARARMVWLSAGKSLPVEGLLELAASYRRLGEWRHAETCWMRAFASGSGAAACELSKYHEHRRRDLRRAMRFASHCTAKDRHLRLRRIARKLDAQLQFDLFASASVDETDDIPFAVSRRQTTA